MTHARANEWATRHGCRPLHVNNGLQGLIGVEHHGMTYLAQYGDDISQQAAFVAAVQSAQLGHASAARHLTGD